MTHDTAPEATSTPTAGKLEPGRAGYDTFAAAYAHENETGLFNAWYERPEMLRLSGDVEALHVLDAGCGHGPLLQELHNRGAIVSGFDISSAMIELAREGMTIVPLRLYFDARGMVKLLVGVAKGKKAADKREASATRDWNRQKARILKEGARG